MARAGDVTAADIARSLVTGEFRAADRTTPSAGVHRRPQAASGEGRCAETGPAHSGVRPALGRRRPGLRLALALVLVGVAPGQGPGPRRRRPKAKTAHLLGRRGADRRAGGRRPGLCPQPGDRAPRHQALEPPARRPGHRLGDRLRAGQGQRPAGPHPHRRRPRHPAVHAPRGVRGQDRRLGRRLLAGPDALRAARLAPGVSARRTGPG